MDKNVTSKRQADFAQRLTTILNDGALNLALAIGYQLALFDVMDRMASPFTSRELARKAGLHPRYITEWLGIMATGRIVDIVDRETEKAAENGAYGAAGKDDRSSQESRETTYALPSAHAALLTRRAGSGNMGVYTQEIPLLTRIAMAGVTADFAEGRGMPFSAYPTFQDFMAQLSHAKHREVLIQHFLPGVDNGGVLARMEQGIRVCDVGCGQGIALHLMAERFPASLFTGIDTHVEAIDTARTLAAEKGLSNLTFMVRDAARIPDHADLFQSFDYITAFDAIHDQTHPLAALKGVRHMLAPGGVFSMVDIDAASDHAGNMDHPMGPFLYTVSLMHCMPVGMTDQGRGLGMMWGRERAASLLKEAGFNRVEILEMAHDPFNVHYLCRV